MNQYIEKEKANEVLKRDRQRFRALLNNLTENQTMETRVSDQWTIKDVIVHISAAITFPAIFRSCSVIIPNPWPISRTAKVKF